MTQSLWNLKTTKRVKDFFFFKIAHSTSDLFFFIQKIYTLVVCINKFAWMGLSSRQHVQITNIFSVFRVFWLVFLILPQFFLLVICWHNKVTENNSNEMIYRLLSLKYAAAFMFIHKKNDTKYFIKKSNVYCCLEIQMENVIKHTQIYLCTTQNSVE